MAHIVNVEQMRALESEADRKGVSYDRMMDRAGEAVFNWTVRQSGPASGKRVVVLCGGGNNGGDGLVAAVHFAQAGAAVRTFLAVERRSGDPRRKAAQAAGCSVEECAREAGYPALAESVKQADVLIDAVLGTGFRLPLRPPILRFMETVGAALAQRRRRPFITAVDCPSGVDCDSGETAPQAIAADLTVTLGAAKPGLVAFPAAESLGRLVVADIGLPGDLEIFKEPGPLLADSGLVGGWLTPRPRNSHKGTYGRVIIVGGSANYPGAPALAGLGAYRTGAGLVTLAVPVPVHPAAVSIVPEATWIVLPDDMGVITAGAAEVLLPEAAAAEALVLGPGMGREKQTAAFLKEMLCRGQGKKAHIGFGAVEKTVGGDEVRRPPWIVDADALRVLSTIPEWWKMLPPGSILTPHPGEMAALTGLAVEAIQRDRTEIALRFAKAWNAVVVLKGAFTVAAAPDGRCAVEPFATPALAKAGTGDVLAGVVGGLVAQGRERWQAAVLGAYLHGRAGELAAEQAGASDSVMAGDAALYLSRSIAELRHAE
ncbi:MAG: NAD(P)H-hydrate dehydratase [Anaerolineales bacterium]|nr:NAD(P)H-hydrate dehydratase [Anaerolineales bacterium]